MARCVRAVRAVEVPWRLEEGNALGFGPIPLREVAGYLGTLRSQVNKANESVQGERHRRAMAEYLDAEERARAYRQAMDALSGLFSQASQHSRGELGLGGRPLLAARNRARCAQRQRELAGKATHP